MDKQTAIDGGVTAVGKTTLRSWTPESIAHWKLEAAEQRLAVAAQVADMVLAFDLEYPPWKSRHRQCPVCARKEGQEHAPDCEWGKAIAAWREQQAKGD